MNPFDLYHVTAEAAIAYMKKPDNLEPLQKLCEKVMTDARQEQRRADLEETRRCEARLIFNCPLLRETP